MSSFLSEYPRGECGDHEPANAAASRFSPAMKARDIGILLLGTVALASLGGGCTTKKEDEKTEVVMPDRNIKVAPDPPEKKEGKKSRLLSDAALEKYIRSIADFPFPDQYSEDSLQILVELLNVYEEENVERTGVLEALKKVNHSLDVTRKTAKGPATYRIYWDAAGAQWKLEVPNIERKSQILSDPELTKYAVILANLPYTDDEKSTTFLGRVLYQLNDTERVLLHDPDQLEQLRKEYKFVAEGIEAIMRKGQGHKLVPAYRLVWNKRQWVTESLRKEKK